MSKIHPAKQKHTDSTDIVAPFARIRVVAAIVLVAIAVSVLIYRNLAG